MTDYVWDSHTGAHLLSIQNDRVYRARDGREIARVVDGNIYDFGGRFVCGLASLEASDRADATIPEVLRLLLG